MAATGGHSLSRGFWWFGEDRDLALTTDPFTATVTSVDGGYRVDVTATGVVKDLALLANGVAPDAVVDDMLFTLLPGEQALIQVRCGGLADAHALLGPDVLRCANDLLSRPGPSRDHR